MKNLQSSITEVLDFLVRCPKCKGAHLYPAKDIPGLKEKLLALFEEHSKERVREERKRIYNEMYFGLDKLGQHRGKKEMNDMSYISRRGAYGVVNLATRAEELAKEE